MDTPYLAFAPVITPSAGTSAVHSSDQHTADAKPTVLHTELTGILHLLTCGSVDDGKSTLIGRLLWEAADLPEDQKQSIIRSSIDGRPDFSLLLDGLIAEREQGITIDIAWR